MYKLFELHISADPAFTRMAFNWRHGARVGKSCFGESTAKVQQNTINSTRVKTRPDKSCFGESTAKVQLMPFGGNQGGR